MQIKIPGLKTKAKKLIKKYPKGFSSLCGTEAEWIQL